MYLYKESTVQNVKYWQIINSIWSVQCVDSISFCLVRVSLLWVTRECGFFSEINVRILQTTKYKKKLYIRYNIQL